MLDSENSDSTPEEDQNNNAKDIDSSPKKIESSFNNSANFSDLLPDGIGKGKQTNAPRESICLEPTVPHGQCKDTNDDNMAGILHPVSQDSSSQPETVCCSLMFQLLP